MKTILIFLIGLLLPAAKPCLNTVKFHEGTPGMVTRQEVSPGTVARRDSSQVKPLVACLQSLPALEPKIKFINFFARSPLITDLLSLTTEIKPFLPYIDTLLGVEKPITYLVLLQNNHEMRANGGFFGSYAVIEVSPGTVARRERRSSDGDPVGGFSWDGSPKGFLPGETATKISLRFQDIYVPDGALIGHVDPPAPIQTAFKQGWFKLRDSDWEPDWPTTAKTIRWFLEKGNEVNPDFLLTLNLTTIEKIMKVIVQVPNLQSPAGSEPAIYVPEYNFKLTADNLYALLQNQAELNFFQGSTQKKDVLTAAGRAISKKLSSLKFDQYIQLVQILLNQLNRGNLLVNSTNPEIQKTLEQKNWAGQLNGNPPGCQRPNCLNDTVLLIETNLGANKANCCVERKTAHTLTKGETEISHLINLTFTNSSPLENPLPPRFYGGNYISYLRFYLPENARNIRLTAQPTLPKTLTQYPIPFDGIKQKLFDRKFTYGLTEVGFFHLTAAGTKSAVQLSYDLPLDDNPTAYQLTLLKQHGLESSPQEINLFGKSHSTDLETDFGNVLLSGW